MRSSFLQLSALAAVATAYHWPSPKFDALEALLYERSPEPAGPFLEAPSLVGLLNKCQPSSTGVSVAAQWIRFAYHDMATHNVDDGTGGLDASLYFERDRDENVGDGMTATVFELIDFPDKYVSKSDVEAVGVVLSVAECGGPTIPFRMGRIDATGPGPQGVPKPEQDIATHIESFRKQGFTQSEMISLVACGHTFGGVRSPDFPEIVPPPADGSELISNFDTTPKFDNLVVTQYLDSTTQNPLAVNSNKTVISDFRVFSSDKNVTMKRLAQPNVFAKTCQDLLERMINTVPKGVKLSEVIKPLPVKVGGVQLSVTQNAMRLKAMLRLATANPKRKITMFWQSRDGKSCTRTACSATFVGTNDTTTVLTRRAGMNPQKYWFDTPVNATLSASKFWFEVDEQNGKKPIVLDNEGTGYELQDRVLFDTRRTKSDFSEEIFSFVTTVVVAIRDDITPSRVYATAMWRKGDVKHQTFDLHLAEDIAPTAGYVFYKGDAVGSSDFSIDIFSVVNGKTFVEDNRRTEFLEFS
ncbi:hypothetical protein D9613_008672 [Agrocybe pediades]|uniref:Peroxidase n=1 Tax=Agrocybe pediades TaxID=84607 RepID=A0A8H4VQ94_9AGAR|nr:hypothetical protein D9613_008672 [Agrocybe pediades]